MAPLSSVYVPEADTGLPTAEELTDTETVVAFAGSGSLSDG